MNCPKCENKTIVSMTRAAKYTADDPELVYRLRVCGNCDYAFWSEEKLINRETKVSAMKAVQRYEKMKQEQATKNQTELFSQKVEIQK